MMDGNESLGIFYEAGCGKTMIALGWLYEALERGDIEDALIICPASLVDTWEQAIPKMLMFEGYTAEGVERVKNTLHITSFQKVYKSTISERSNSNGETECVRKVTLRPEVDKHWGAIIIDESHNIGAHNSVQTQSCITLSKLAKYRYIMSGTPISGGGGKEDFKKLYGQMLFLHPGMWKNWTNFCNKFVTRYDEWFKPLTYNEEKCKKLMEDYSITARLRDCYDMPEYTDTEIICPLAEKKVYKDIAKGNILKYNISIDVSGAQYIKLRQICSGSLKTDDGSITEFKTSKDDALINILEGTDDKVVIFCNFRASVDRVEKICKKCGKETVVFDGRSKSPTWREFQFGTANALVCQYQSGGVGIDLFASATEIFFEPCTSSLLYEQSKARIMRKGQTKHCRYLIMTTPNTTEHDTWTCVRSGMDATDKTLEALAKLHK